MNAEQYSRNAKANVLQKGEHPMNVLANVENVVVEAMQDGDDEICHRVLVRKTDAESIVVQFVIRKIRNEFVGKSRQKRVFQGDLAISSHGPIFINEHLCPTLKK